MQPRGEPLSARRRCKRALVSLLCASGLLCSSALAQGIWISVADGKSEVPPEHTPPLGLRYFSEGAYAGRLQAIGNGSDTEHGTALAPLFLRWANKQVSCTGVAVSEAVLLTAAHCLAEQSESVEVKIAGEGKTRRMHCRRHANSTVAACWLDSSGKGFVSHKPLQPASHPAPWQVGEKLRTASLEGCDNWWGERLQPAEIKVVGPAPDSTYDRFEARSKKEVAFCHGDSGTPALLMDRSAVVATLISGTSNGNTYYVPLQSTSVFEFLKEFQAAEPATGKPCTRISGLPPPSSGCI